MQRLVLAAMAVVSWAGVPAQAAQSPGVPKLCDDSDPAKITVFLGRFLEFGTGRNNDTESLVSSGVLSTLRTMPEIASSKIQEQQTELVGPNFAGIFIGGIRDDEKTRDLGATLSKYGCQYLFGGQISQQGPLQVFTPYLLDTAKGQVIAALRPFFFDKNENMSRVGERAANSLHDFLKGQAKSAVITRSKELRVELGCMVPADKANDELTDVLEAIRAAAASRVRSWRDLRPGNSLDKDGSCLDTEGIDSVTASADSPFAVVTGSLQVESRLVTINPSVVIRSSDDGRFKPSVIRLPSVEVTIPADDPSAVAPSIASRYVLAVGAFLANITDDRWRLPFDSSEVPTLSGERLRSFVDEQIKTRKSELAVFAGYLAYTAAPRDPYANYFLAKALLAKDEIDAFILHHLDIANTSEQPLPSLLLADLQEERSKLLGPRRIKEAIQALQAAMAIYDKLQRPRDSARVRRTLASAQIRQGDLQRAKNILTAQPDHRTDIDTLEQLTRLSVTMEQDGEAEKWISIAAGIERTSRVNLVLGDLTRSLGLRYLNATDYAKAAEQFRSSLTFVDNPEARYLLGLALLRGRLPREAAREYENLLLRGGSARDLDPRMLEGAWLNLLESYLLDQNSDVEHRVTDVNQALQSQPRSLIIANYLVVVSRLLRNVYPTVGALEKEDRSYRDLLGLLGRHGEMRISGWNNAQVNNKVEESSLPDDKKAFIRNLTAKVFPSPPPSPVSSPTRR